MINKNEIHIYLLKLCMHVPNNLELVYLNKT